MKNKYYRRGVGIILVLLLLIGTCSLAEYNPAEKSPAILLRGVRDAGVAVGSIASIILFVLALKWCFQDEF